MILNSEKNQILVLDEAQFFAALKEKKYPGQSSYLAFYSSWFGGIVKDPSLMMIPMDDHLVHRGDGVFEAFKIIENRIYLFKEHYSRLLNSSKRIGLTLDWSESEVLFKAEQVIQVARQVQSHGPLMLRLFVSRGPGNYSTNPYDSVGSQLHLVVTKLSAPSYEKYQQGASLAISSMVMKGSDWAAYKTCNYLANVMIKKEAVDRKVDFCVAHDPEGFLSESSTENLLIVNAHGKLQKPGSNFILQGTTMNRIFQLAEGLEKEKLISGREEKSFTKEELFAAQEVMIVGTTWDVLPVTIVEGKKVGHGKPGPVAQALSHLLLKDQGLIK